MMTQFLKLKVLVAGIALLSLAVHGYPPAPHHTFFGMVKDQMGNPINVKGSVVILESLSGVQIKAEIQPGLEPGVNYRLSVPMDAGLTEDAYKPTALRPSIPFRIKVNIGNVTYLPIQMRGDYSQLGKPGQMTRLDLTLGEDVDGDGLPDLWELALIAAMGGNLTLADIGPNADSDNDGLSNLQEYLAGSYAFDPADGFSLQIVRVAEGQPVLEFLTLRGRSYSIHGSSDLANWTPISFRVLQGETESSFRDSYYSQEIRKIQVQANPGQTSIKFFKLMAQ